MSKEQIPVTAEQKKRQRARERTEAIAKASRTLVAAFDDKYGLCNVVEIRVGFDWNGGLWCGALWSDASDGALLEFSRWKKGDAS